MFWLGFGVGVYTTIFVGFMTLFVAAIKRKDDKNDS